MQPADFVKYLFVLILAVTVGGCMGSINSQARTSIDLIMVDDVPLSSSIKVVEPKLYIGEAMPGNSSVGTGAVMNAVMNGVKIMGKGSNADYYAEGYVELYYFPFLFSTYKFKAKKVLIVPKPFPSNRTPPSNLFGITVPVGQDTASYVQ